MIRDIIAANEIAAPNDGLKHLLKSYSRQVQGSVKVHF